MSQGVFVHLKYIQNYEYVADFGGGLPEIILDEPSPVGSGKGPDPAQLLAAAVGNCLSNSLFYSLKRLEDDPTLQQTDVEVIAGKNVQGRRRILELKVLITLANPAAGYKHLNQALAQFEEFSVVGASVRAGIPVQVQVKDSAGSIVK